MANAHVTVRGIQQMKGMLTFAAYNFEDVVQKALMEEMEIEKQEVIARIPKDTTALSESTHLIEGNAKGQKIKGRVAATILVGDDTINPKTQQATKEYAAKVHNDLEAHHDEGQALYLTSVLNESKPYMIDRVMRHPEVKKLFMSKGGGA